MINKLLKLLELPDNINFNYEIAYTDVDEAGLKKSEKKFLTGNYIEYCKFLKRDKHEFWNSIDLYIRKEKNEEVLILCEKFLYHKNFCDIKDNETIYQDVIEDNIRLDLIKINDYLVLQITKFVN